MCCTAPATRASAVTSSGLVKVLDFGLAKLARSEGAATDSVSPTVSAAVATAQGALLGTPAYMSPEQAEGRAADARSDIFSFDAVLYEMLTGKRPFEGASEVSLLSAILRDTPPTVRSVRPEVDPRLDMLVQRCLEKDPGARSPSAQALLPDLEACLKGDARPSGRALLPRWAWVGGLVLLLGATAFALWAWRRGAHERWARREALPEIQRLIDADEITSAFRLAGKARPVLAGDPQFDKLWLDLIEGAASVRTEPADAEVSVRPYSEPDAEWRKLGRTPVETVELPRVFSRFRIEKPGYAPAELAFAPMVLTRHPPFRLVPTSAAPSGMVLVPGGRFKYQSAPEVELGDFWLDRHEVTNRQYEAFVSAGGYRRRELWKQPFVRHGQTLSFEAAMALFRDRTGRPGPSTWQLASFPEGHAEFPVSGVSWHEAAAYAEFAGKSLPTLHHWYRAADLSRFSDILRYSNFGDQGPRPVGAQPSLTSYGNYDMARQRPRVGLERRGRAALHAGRGLERPHLPLHGARRARPHGQEPDPRGAPGPVRKAAPSGLLRLDPVRRARPFEGAAGRRQRLSHLQPALRL